MDLRRHPRATTTLPVTLMRRVGGPVFGHTEDVGAGGARVVVDRPLALDEEVAFDLDCPAGHVDGRARVLRQQGPNRYALRFEALDDAAASLLTAVVSRTQ